MSGRPILVMVKPHGDAYEARQTSPQSAHVGRGADPAAAFADLVRHDPARWGSYMVVVETPGAQDGVRPGKGFHPPQMRRAAENGGDGG
jgi:hypothetical protein